LKWVNKYISLFGGDPSNVSAWGESAGAGSIYWLLTQQGGTEDPLFHRAIVQSPAFADNIDRHGLMEEQFQDFATLAGCAGQGLACLRRAKSSDLTAAGANLTWSPGLDGKYFRQHPTLEFTQGT
jgi:carboxylesterase type B